MSKVNVFSEGFHQHSDKVLLGVGLLLEELDEGVVLEEDVHADEVDFLEVGVSDAVVEEVLGDEGDELAVEGIVELTLLADGTSGKVTAWESCKLACKAVRLLS